MYSPPLTHCKSLWQLSRFLSSPLQSHHQTCVSAVLSKCSYWSQSSHQAENSAGVDFKEKQEVVNSIGHIGTPAVTHSITVKKASKELREAILQIKDPLSTLDFTVKNLNLNSATVCLQQILMLCVGNEGKEIPKVCNEILIDTRFINLSNYIHRKIEHLSYGELLSCFKSIIMLTPKDIYLCESLATQVLFSLRKMPLNLVVRILEILRNHRETDLRQKLYHEALATVDKRWVELSNPKELLKLMYMYSANENSFYGKLEERALDLTEKMSPTSLYRVLYLLSRRHSRNTPLIRSVVYHLNKAKLELNINHLKNILFACSSLNIYDQGLLEKLMSDIKNKISQTENLRIATSVLMSCSSLRWVDTELFKIIFTLLEKQVDKLSKEDCTLAVTTLARLNLDKKQYGDFFNLLLRKLQTENLQENDPGSWLDVVWSLGIVDGLDQYHIGSVLDSKFFEALPAVYEKDTHRLLASHVKLLNIEAVSRLDLPDYTGQHLPDEWHSTATPSCTKAHRNLAESIVLALSNMAPLGKYLKADVVSKYGYFIDAELCVNKKGSAVPYDDGISNPDEHKRIAIKVLDFYDMTLPKPAPLGQFCMAARHLDKMGYTVIMVPYHEWSGLSTVVKKVQYLEKKIKDAIV